MTFYKIAFFVLFLSFNLFACSQDISKYLDDGGFSTGKSILKTGIDPINGMLSILFEHSLNQKMSLEGGAGLVSLERQNWLYSLDPLPIASSGLGYTVSGAFKIYFHTFPERSYFAFQSGITMMSGKLFTDAASLNYGYQRSITGKWMIEIEMGLGVRLFKDTTMYGDIASPDKESRLLFPVSIGTGYMF